MPLNFKSGVVPPGAIVVQPGDDLQAKVAASPIGSTFYISKGVYRLQTIRPRAGDNYIGAEGAILNGARILSSFEQSGGRWYVQLDLAALRDNQQVGSCERGYVRCNFRHDVFVDSTLLTQVDSLADLVAGTCFFDYVANRIYLADNPAGHLIELSMSEYAFLGNEDNVHIQNLIVEKYANPAQTGAINAISPSGPYSNGWIVRHCEIRMNHGTGLVMGSHMQVLRNTIHNNGQMGLAAGGGRNSIVQDNEIANNNTSHYDPDWEAGGTKFVNTRDLDIAGNYVHDNYGPGLWSDVDNIGTVYENNRLENNEGAGILHEISFDAVIKNNVLTHDGYAANHKTSLWWGAGILISNSSNVEVYGNKLTECMNGIGAILTNRGSSKWLARRYLVQNLNIHDNTIERSAGAATGIVSDLGTPVYTDWGNTWHRNTYQLRNSPADGFIWMNAPTSWKQWRTYGNDVDGRCTIAGKGSC